MAGFIMSFKRPYFIFYILFITTVFIFCESTTNPSNPQQSGNLPGFVPQWTRNIPLTDQRVSDYEHDNRIYETMHFLVYSDEANDSTKIQFAELAEEAYTELKPFFHIPTNYNFDILMNDPYTKIQIICNKSDPRSQRSFVYGFMLYTLDSPYNFATTENFYREVKHELTHVFQMYLDGSSRHYPNGWFREGLAEYAADGGFFPPVNSLSQFKSLQYLLDGHRIHPLKIRWSQLVGQPGELHAAAYAMSGLAIRYLLDPLGYGKSILDIRRLFSLLKDDGHPFESAFQECMGISVKDYENNFYDLMNGYLN